MNIPSFYLRRMRLLCLAVLLLCCTSLDVHAQLSPQELVFSGLDGYWVGTTELRSAAGDTTTLSAALDIRRSFDGAMITVHRSLRAGDEITVRIEVLQFDPDSLLLRSAAAEGSTILRHRYSVQGLHRVHSDRNWVIRRTENDSLEFRRVTDVMQNDSLIVLKETSVDGMHWSVTELMRLAEQARPDRARFYLPGFPHARNVFVIGDFNGWSPGRTPMRRVRDGWRTDIDLPPGEYQYKFWVDGSRVRDLLTASVIADGDGGYNAILTVR